MYCYMTIRYYIIIIIIINTKLSIIQLLLEITIFIYKEDVWEVITFDPYFFNSWNRKMEQYENMDLVLASF